MSDVDRDHVRPTHDKEHSVQSLSALSEQLDEDVE